MINKKLSQRDQHRVLRVVWTVCTVIISGLLLFFMYGSVELAVMLLTVFIVGIALFVGYEIVLWYELVHAKKKDNMLIRNSMFQIYFGKITLISAAFSFLTGFFFNLETTVVLFLFASLTLIILFSSFAYVRGVIEEKTPLKG